MEKAVVDELSDAGKGFMSKNFTKRQRFSKSLPNKESKKLFDNFYLGNSLYFDNTKTGAVKDSIALQKQTLLWKCDRSIS
jgi:hypothetical protein